MKQSRQLAVSVLLTMALASNSRGQTARPVPEKAPRNTPDTYGTTTESYYRMAASEFTAAKSDNTYSDQLFQPGGTDFGRFTTPANGNFVGSPHLPSGALLTYLELDSCDVNALASVVLHLYDCDYTGHCGAAVQILSSVDNVTPNACSYVAADVSGLGLVINNYGRQLSLDVETEAGDASTSLSGVIFGYKLQVAPPPATATFDDVPTGYPYFQFIEALSDWGITSGCNTSPPQYCPDRFITRGEMAVYMAKALGLYLPQY